MDPRSSSLVGNRRGPIPRPWLAEHHYIPPPVHPLHQEYRYAPPTAGAPYSTTPDSLDLLPGNEWTVSWNKLTCCFCLRGQTRPSSQKSNQWSSHHGTNGGNRRHYNDHNVPFPAFPILRRNSSSSLLANQNDVYPSSGSVSSFTESDTSTDSDINAVRNETFDSEELQLPISPPRASTPPPAPVTHKPAAVSNRSRSAGLPPMKPNSNSSWATPQPPPARSRIDTGDYTGVYSGTTNTSKHRRKQQFEFSPRSMEQIWQGKVVDENLVLPSYVLLQESNTTRPNDSGYISALDESEDWGTPNSPGSYYDGDYDDDRAYGDGDDEYSPFAKLQQHKKAGERKKRRKGDRPPKASSGTRQNREGRRNHKKDQRPPPGKPRSQAEQTMVPTYLPKNSKLDKTMDGTLVLSGWVAASIGCSLEDRLHRGSKRIGAKDIYYLRIVDEYEGAMVVLHTTDGGIAHELRLRPDWMCESREISSRIGRCVNIRSRSNPMFPIANLLPVSLDDSFFRGGKLISAQQFAQQHEQLFVAGEGKVYAPDEQHDAAMYIMFSLDALIKNCL